MALLLLGSCNVTKSLYEDEVLVTRNKISGMDKLQRTEMQLFVRPRANRKLLGLFRTKAWIHQRATRGRGSAFWNRINESLGEPPALLDSTQIFESRTNLERYLRDKGYFFGQVQALVEVNKRNPKKARVHFQIQPGPRYQVRNIEYVPTQSSVDAFVLFHLYESRSFPMSNGAAYDADELSRGRGTLANYLREQGFFYFNRDLIFYDVDTALGNQQVDIKVRIKRPKEPYYFESFKFDSIVVNVDYQVFQSTQPSNEQDTVQQAEYYFIDRVPSSINKDILIQNLLFRKNLTFSESAMRLTQSRISDLKVYNYNNIRIIPNDSARTLNVLMNLTPSPKRQLKFDSEVSTNSISLFGISGGITELRRNVFKGGELLEFRINAGIESQQNVTNTDVLSRTTFNTLEFGFGTSLTIPRFLWPFNAWNNRFYTAPRTRFGINYSRQIRLDFTREVFQTNVGFLWMNRARERFEVFPAEISFARTARISQNLSDVLNQIQDPFLQFSFTNYINLASRFAYSVDNINTRGTFMRVNIEFAGNALHAIYRAFDIQEGQNPRTLLGLPYFQYVRADLEYRKHWQHGEHSKLASRIFIGLGLPLQNSIILPLEKRYFAGGTNSIRAWLARSVGPGGYGVYGARLDQFGEMRLEANLEERFPIFGKFQGAVFVDAGNIWTLKDTTAAKGELANFAFNRFYKEIAIGTGFGLRYDFTYFVIRIDMGLKVHDPALRPGNRWVIANINDRIWRQTTWRDELNINAPLSGRYPFTSFNLGINFPF